MLRMITAAHPLPLRIATTVQVSGDALRRTALFRHPGLARIAPWLLEGGCMNTTCAFSGSPGAPFLLETIPV
jgi:hypothetical protein